LQELNQKLEIIENNYQNNKIKLHALDLDKKNIVPFLEKQIEQKERLEYLLEEQNDLIKLRNTINLAKEELENAYYEMKNNVTPRFTEKLSETISKITGNKYNHLKINDENGLMVELEDGSYKNCNVLSIGTIDQMYLSLRLSALKEITEENIPILLDEAFCYYDEERLRNILIFLNEQTTNQVLIFTCSNREKEILDELKIQYNFVLLNNI